MARKSSLPWSHFKVLSPNCCHAFTLGTCDECGSQIEEPNAVKIMEHPSKLKSLGMIEWEGPLLSEIYYDETKASESSCDNCC